MKRKKLKLVKGKLSYKFLNVFNPKIVFTLSIQCTSGVDSPGSKMYKWYNWVENWLWYSVKYNTKRMVQVKYNTKRINFGMSHK